MTRYSKRRAVAVTAERLAACAEQPQNHRVDPAAVSAFARAHMRFVEVNEMTEGEASDFGIVALALAGRAMREIRKKVQQEPCEGVGPAERFAQILAEELLPLDVKHLEGALKDTERATEVVRNILINNENAKVNKRLHTSRLFGRALDETRLAADGHVFTRECALKLRLARYFEKTSSEFDALVHRLFAVLAQNGPAYTAWSMRLPILVCDLNVASHRRAAHLALELAHGALAVVSAPLQAAARTQLAQKMLVVQDRDGLFAAVIGRFAPVMLLERRLGGWTVTFPTGPVDRRLLADKKLPALARSLAACAVSASRPEGVR